MNNDEAKFRLRAYRPNGADAQDPVFDEALRHARQDPSLSAWQAREQAFDAALAAKVNEIAPPAGLRDAILSGVRIESRKRRWPVPALALLAACLILGVFLTWHIRSRERSLPAFATAALDDALHGRHGSHGPAVKAFCALLSDPAVSLREALPVNFAQLQATGCRTLRIAGRDVVEVCFLRENTEYHLYVSLLGSSAPEIAPRFISQSGMAAATWTDSAHAFVLAAAGGEATLRRLL